MMNSHVFVSFFLFAKLTHTLLFIFTFFFLFVSFFLLSLPSHFEVLVLHKRLFHVSIVVVASSRAHAALILHTLLLDLSYFCCLKRLCLRALSFWLSCSIFFLFSSSSSSSSASPIKDKSKLSVSAREFTANLPPQLALALMNTAAMLGAIAGAKSAGGGTSSAASIPSSASDSSSVLAFGSFCSAFPSRDSDFGLSGGGGCRCCSVCFFVPLRLR